MIIDVAKPMSPRQVEMFWNEIELIQGTYPSFFPEEQKKTISLDVCKNASILEFSNEYSLPDLVTQDIRAIFKLVAMGDDVYEEYQLLRLKKK